MENSNEKNELFFNVVDQEVHATVSVGRDKTDVIIPDTYDGLPVTTVTFQRHDCHQIKIKDLVLGNNVNKVKFQKAKDYPHYECDFGIDLKIDTIKVPDSLVKLPKYFLSKLASDASYLINSTHPTYKIIDNVLINKKRGSIIRFLDSNNVSIPENDEIKIISKTCEANIFSDSGLNIPKNIAGIEIDNLDSYFYIQDISADNENFIFKDNGLIIDPRTKTLLKYNGNLESLDLIDEDITKIAPGAFYNNKDLKEIILPKVLTIIGRGAFKNCSNLVNVKFNRQLSYVYENAFSDCTSLKKAIFKSKIMGMVYDVFCGCTSLHHISYPEFIFITVYDDLWPEHCIMLDYPKRCKLPKICKNDTVCLILTDDHYDELILNKDCYYEALFSDYDKDITVDKLIIDANLKYFGMSGKIHAKEVIITDKASSAYKYVDNTLMKTNGLLLNYYVPEGSKEYRFSNEVRIISSYWAQLNSGAKKVETVIIPKEVESISFFEDEYHVCPIIDCENLIIENPNFILDEFFLGMDGLHFPYKNLIIDVSNSEKYKKEGNYLVDKNTNEKMLPLNTPLHYDTY